MLNLVLLAHIGHARSHVAHQVPIERLEQFRERARGSVQNKIQMSRSATEQNNLRVGGTLGVDRKSSGDFYFHAYFFGDCGLGDIQYIMGGSEKGGTTDTCIAAADLSNAGSQRFGSQYFCNNDGYGYALYSDVHCTEYVMAVSKWDPADFGGFGVCFDTDTPSSLLDDGVGCDGCDVDDNDYNCATTTETCSGDETIFCGDLPSGGTPAEMLISLDGDDCNVNSVILVARVRTGICLSMVQGSTPTSPPKMFFIEWACSESGGIGYAWYASRAECEDPAVAPAYSATVWQYRGCESIGGGIYATTSCGAISNQFNAARPTDRPSQPLTQLPTEPFGGHDTGGDDTTSSLLVALAAALISVLVTAVVVTAFLVFKRRACWVDERVGLAGHIALVDRDVPQTHSAAEEEEDDGHDQDQAASEGEGNKKDDEADDEDDEGNEAKVMNATDAEADAVANADATANAISLAAKLERRHSSPRDSAMLKNDDTAVLEEKPPRSGEGNRTVLLTQL